MFAESLSAFFAAADFGVTATHGGESAQVILDAPNTDILGGRGMTTEPSILYKTGDLPTLKRGDAIVVDGVNYTVNETPQSVDDGKLRRALLSKT